MAQKIQSSFSAGELDPALHERTTFDKYKTGLKTLRNAIIGKTGRIVSRAGTKYERATRNPILAPITFTVDAGIDTVIVSANRFRDGDKVILSSTTTLPAPFVAGTTYFAQYANSTSIHLCATAADVLAGVNFIDITTAGTGTHTLTPVNPIKKSILFAVPYTDFFLEWGHGYVRIHDTRDNSVIDADHLMTESDLPYVQFVPANGYVNVFCKDNFAQKVTVGALDTTDPFRTLRIEKILIGFVGIEGPLTEQSRSITGTGQDVQYAVSMVADGEEFTASSLTFALLPISAAQKNTIVISKVGNPKVDSLRIYRRPLNGIAFGYMATVTAGASTGTFTDYGEDVDYTEQPILPIDQNYSSTIISVGFRGRTGCVYQQRLLGTDNLNEELIFASRTGYRANFWRDVPYSVDSGLVFKCGTSGYARVLYLIDSGGLLAFTTAGIFMNTGGLSPTNVSFEEKGSWVASDTLVPLKVPGGLLFVDRTTNSIRNLIFSNEAGGFPGDEVSVFSDHLFRGRTVISWAFQDGETPLVHVVFNDGKAAAFNYDREHKMRAWARADTDGLFESVTVKKDLAGRSVVYYVVNRDGNRGIESGTDRTLTTIKDLVCMDSSVSYNSELSAGASLDVTANDPMDWEGLLTLTSDIAIFANTTDLGAIGSIFRMFDSDGAAVDLTVTAYTSTTVVEATPSVTFPSAESTDITIYRTYSTLTGLSHLNGKIVSLMVDGYVEASPNNDVENYGDLLVSGGGVTIPSGRRGAFVHVGLPFTCDVETLDIDTVEQKPALLEAKMVQKVNVKVFNSRGLYVGSTFPENDYVQGLTDIETRSEDIDLGNIGNASQVLQTKRIEIIIPNDWDSNGRVCFRQVDPLPFEILSIIPDLNIGG